MKLKLEKDFKPLSFDILTPDEIAKKKRLIEEKERRQKQKGTKETPKPKRDAQKQKMALIPDLFYILGALLFILVMGILNAL